MAVPKVEVDRRQAPSAAGCGSNTDDWIGRVSTRQIPSHGQPVLIGPARSKTLPRICTAAERLVIVERADRLARDLMVSEVIINQLTRAGARVLTADGVDLTSGDDDPTRRLIRQVLGAVSEFEKRVIVLKLRAARERKRARGERVEGVKPYGHFPAEQAVLERMRQLRRKPAKGKRPSVATVAALLNAEGHRNRAGREWSPQMVHHVLR